MKNLFTRAIFISFFCLVAGDLFAQNNPSNVSIDAVIRPRFEVQYGYKYPPDTSSTPQILASQRTRLNAYFSNEKFKAYVSFQDARYWGDEIQGTDVPSVNMHEAWAQYNFCKTVGLK